MVVARRRIMPSMHQTIDSSPSFVEHIDDLRSLVVVCGISDHSLLSEDVKEELKSAGEGGFICISGNDVSTKCTIFIKNSSSHYLVFKVSLQIMACHTIRSSLLIFIINSF